VPTVKNAWEQLPSNAPGTTRLGSTFLHAHFNQRNVAHLALGLSDRLATLLLDSLCVLAGLLGGGGL
jgi:hypothetical protein